MKVFTWMIFISLCLTPIYAIEGYITLPLDGVTPPSFPEEEVTPPPESSENRDIRLKITYVDKPTKKSVICWQENDVRVCVK